MTQEDRVKAFQAAVLKAYEETGIMVTDKCCCCGGLQLYDAESSFGQEYPKHTQLIVEEFKDAALPQD